MSKQESRLRTTGIIQAPASHFAIGRQHHKGHTDRTITNADKIHQAAKLNQLARELKNGFASAGGQQ